MFSRKNEDSMCVRRQQEKLAWTVHSQLRFAMFAFVPNDFSSSILIAWLEMYQLNECVLTRRQSCLDENLKVHRMGYRHIGQEEHAALYSNTK